MVIVYILIGALCSLAGLAVIAFALFLFTTKPRKRNPLGTELLMKTRVAHRGLHDREKGIPENSLAAFEKALEGGFGAEFDVHLTADNQLVVIHDDNIKRVCGTDRCVSKSALSELSGERLCGTDEKIPLFTEVLDTLFGKVPLVIELKVDGENYAALCSSVMAVLKRYEEKIGVGTAEGAYCIESFHPKAVGYMKKHCKEIVRGQLSCDYSRTKGVSAPLKFCFTNLMCNIISRPDFIAYEKNAIEARGVQLALKFWKPYEVVWTVKTKEEMLSAEKKGRLVIFEGFVPASSLTGGEI